MNELKIEYFGGGYLCYETEEEDVYSALEYLDRVFESAKIKGNLVKSESKVTLCDREGNVIDTLEYVD